MDDKKKFLLSKINALPEILKTSMTHYFELFIKLCNEQNLEIPKKEAFTREFIKSCVTSKFIAETLTANPKKFLNLWQQNFFSTKTINYKTALEKYIVVSDNEIELMQKLREFRRWHMVRIAWCDINKKFNLQQTFTELSKLADSFLKVVTNKVLTWHKNKDLYRESIQQVFIIIALGKLGSYELNFSSDIDLIFCTDSNNPIATPTAQQLVNLLSRATADGFCFRVDLRLRPFGSTGPLVPSINAMSNYYQQQGRDWERFAFAKSRVITGKNKGKELLGIIRQFVFRRYVDYRVIESLRQIKALIRKEGHENINDIKRGPGGIREIEFIVQVFQLIQGGKEPQLQVTQIFYLLPTLAQIGCLPVPVVQELFAAYEFLRILENRLQQFNDKQTHRLPDTELKQQALIFSLGFDHWDDFNNELNKHREKVIKHFNDTIAAPRNKTQNLSFKISPNINKLIYQELDEISSIQLLAEYNFQDPKEIYSNLRRLQSSFSYRRMIKGTFTIFVPIISQLLLLSAKQNNDTETFHRLIAIIEEILRRSVYLSLLLENPGTLEKLVKLCSSSAWIANLVARYPFLLEELVDNNQLYSSLTLEKIYDQLRQRLISIPADDLEQQMECLRRFKQSHIFHIAASEITGLLPLMKISDELTNMATVIVGHATRLAWRHLKYKYGVPCINNIPLTIESFAIIGYGKLGGFELSYTSDLDLVFLHLAEDLQSLTDGDNPISTAEFFMRLAQRIIHILSIQTTTGSLYKVDTRLRPSGQSGLLVTSFDSYCLYQKQKAWIWEHQALVRARVIEGSDTIKHQFNLLRLEILGQSRDTQELKKSIAEMREKMRISKKTKEFLYEIDQGRGGIKDIEFIVQFLVLNHGHQYPEILTFTDNVRILETLNEINLLPAETIKTLTDAYILYRRLVHLYFLQNEVEEYELAQASDLKKQTALIWDSFFSPTEI